MMSYRAIKLPDGIKHSFWSVLDAGLYPVVYLATVPLMMRSMGMVTFGLWILLNSIITILQLFNFNSGIAGLGVATIRNITDGLANNDTERVRDVINSIFQITFFLFVFVCCIGWGLSYAAVRYSWWDIKDAPGANVSLCVLLAAVIAGLKYFDQIFQSIIKACEKFKLSSILNMVCRFGLLGITIIMAVEKYSLAAILFANIVFIIAYLLIQLCCVKWILPLWKPSSVKNKKLYRYLLRFSTWPWLQSVIIVLTFQTDRFWVSSYAGLKEVSSYGLVSTMFSHIHMIITAMVVWILPHIAIMTSKGDDPARMYNLVRSGLFSVVVILLLVFFFISPFLFRLWVGAETYAGMSAYIKGFVAFEIVFAHTIMPFFYLNATGKERLATKATLFYCSTCYMLMLAGLWLFHSPAAMIGGMTIAMCITMPFINAIVQQNMHHSYSWKLAILEMLPMYAAILLVYGNGNMWLYLLLIPVLFVLLWKFYSSTVFKNRLWQHTR